jgi:hypothetical protein
LGSDTYEDAYGIVAVDSIAFAHARHHAYCILAVDRDFNTYTNSVVALDSIALGDTNGDTK